jgi:HK97 family phage portal protein
MASKPLILAAWRDARIAEREKEKEKTTPRDDMTGLSFAEFSDFVRGGADKFSGVVSERTAMNSAAVYACVALLGGAMSNMPLEFFRRGDDNAGVDREQYMPDEWWLFNESPFPAWTAATWREYMMWSLLLQGDSFTRIHRASPLSPKIVGFEPLHPMSVVVRRYGDRLRYQVSPQPSQQWESPAPPMANYDQDDILHVPGPGFDGLRGMSQITSALHTAGSIALSSDDYMANFFKNSARPDFVLETDGKMEKDQQETLREQWNEKYSGTARSFLPAILTGGLKLKAIQLTANDAQLLDTRKFQVEDICRIFGVPPFMVGQTEKTTSWGTGIEQLGIAFVKYTLGRHLVKIEQEINRKIFRTNPRFCVFKTDGLLRGDMKTRHEAYRSAIGRAGEPGWMTIDEVRTKEYMPRMGGDAAKLNPGIPAKAPGADTGDNTQGNPDEPTTATAG